MTKKEAFIQLIEYVFYKEDFYLTEEWKEIYPLAIEYFQELKDGKVSTNKMTENGHKLLSWMKENEIKMSNMFTSKEAAEALFTSGRSIAGTMRKLVNDGYVEKIGKDPVRYSLTENGKNYQLDI